MSKIKPHLLVISQYFYPESFRINDMALEWVKRGYQVTVLTGIPNYPEGQFYKGYGYKEKRHEFWKGVEIYRIPLIPRGNSSIKLIANYISFVISGFIWVLTSKVKADLIFSFEVSPMIQALIGCMYRRKMDVPHYLYITDIWPENVVSITGINNKCIIGLIQKIVDYIYHHTERILVCSPGFITIIQKRGIALSKIEYWPQYAEDFYRPIHGHISLLPQDGILNLVFAGNIGYAQGLDILIEASKKLYDANIDVRFNIIGGGSYLDEFRKHISNANLDHFFNFISRKSPEEIPLYLACADALLITLSKSYIFSITMPSKIQSYMACGKPILVSADGVVQDIIYDAKAGLCSNAEDIDGLVLIIKKFIRMSDKQREYMSSNALIYSHTHYNKEKLMNRMDEIFLY